MTCLRVAETKNFSLFPRGIQNKKTCAIQCALCLITSIGLTLSILAIVSYAPPYAGYCGGGCAVASLIAMAIIHVSRSVVPATRNRASSTSLEDPDTIPGSNTSNIVADVPVRSPIEKLPCEISTHIFSYLDPAVLAKVGQTCTTLSTIAKQEQLWKRHCRNQFIPITDSNTARECFLEVKILAHRLMSTTPRQMTLINHDICSVLAEKDRIFIGLPEGVEVRDRDLKLIKTFKIELKKKIGYPTQLKIMGNTLYCLNTDGKENRQNPDLSFFRFDVITGNIIDNYRKYLENKTYSAWGPNIRFYLKEWNERVDVPIRDRMKKKFLEFTNDQAFVNHGDGSIRVWDLHSDYYCYNDEHIDTDYESDLKYLAEGCPSVDQRHNYDFKKRCTTNGIKYQEMLKKCKILTGHTADLNQLLISDGYLFSSSEDGTIKQWDISKYYCVKTIHTEFPRGVNFFTINGNYIFGYSNDKSTTQCKLWDLTSGECFHSFTLIVTINTCCMRGNLLFYGNKNTLHIYDMSTREEIKSIQVTEEDENIKTIQVVDARIACKLRDKIIIYDF